MDKLLSVFELSDLTGWHPITVYRKGLVGEIPGRIKLGKRSVRFKQSEIEDWLKESVDPSEKKVVNE